MKKWFCLVVVITVGMLASCGNELEDSPEQVLAKFVQLWESGSYSEMYGLVISQEQDGGEEEFVTRYGKISSGLGIKDINLIASSFENDKLSYTLEFSTITVGVFSQDYTMEVVEDEAGLRLNWKHSHILPGLTEDLVVRVTRQMPKRGSILDRNNLELAAMGTVYSIGLVPGKMEEETVSALSALLSKPEADILKELNQSWVRDNTFVPIQTIGAQDWALLQEPLSALPGATARTSVGRIYDIPHSLAQTIGYVGEVDGNRLKSLADKGFRAGDIVGCEGLELIYDSTLTGRPGFTITIRDADNNIISTVAQREAVNGNDIVTTIDIEKCRILDKVLGSRKGSIILLDFETGDLAGAVSKPGFDSNLFALGITPAQYSELVELDSPFLNRAINGMYPPGSAFKPFTALMALEDGACDPEYSWDTPRQWQKNAGWGDYRVTRVSRPLGQVNLWDAMKWSDNVYFADLGLKVGWPAFEKYGTDLGFGEKIPFAINDQVSQVRKGGSGEILLADSSYGQGEMLTTPLHMALMYASLARQDGTLPLPRLSDSDPSGVWLETQFSTDNLRLVDRVLAYAASDQDALAWVGSETVRGKTGTSETGNDGHVAWYVCYFDNYVLAVTLEGDKSLSSTHAVEIARECLNSGLR